MVASNTVGNQKEIMIIQRAVRLTIFARRFIKPLSDPSNLKPKELQFSYVKAMVTEGYLFVASQLGAWVKVGIPLVSAFT